MLPQVRSPTRVRSLGVATPSAGTAGGPYAARALALSAPYLAAGDTSGAAKVWDLRMAPRDDPRAAPLLSCGHGACEVRQLTFGRGGDLLLSGASDGVVRAFDAKRAKTQPLVVADHQGLRVERIALAGRTLASVDSTGAFKLSRVPGDDALRHLDALPLKGAPLDTRETPASRGSPTSVATNWFPDDLAPPGPQQRSPTFIAPEPLSPLDPRGGDAAARWRLVSPDVLRTRVQPNLPKTTALALVVGSLSVVALGHSNGTVSTLALPFPAASFRDREAAQLQKMTANANAAATRA